MHETLIKTKLEYLWKKIQKLNQTCEESKNQLNKKMKNIISFDDRMSVSTRATN